MAMGDRRDYYVYTHSDSSGAVFYVGKGCGKRAWSTDRQDLWSYYVEQHLNGQYVIDIVHDGLSESAAERVESEVARKYGGNLVNVFNQHRPFDHDAWLKHSALSESSRAHARIARELEHSDLPAAIAEYVLALKEAKQADLVVYQDCLYGRIQRERSTGDLTVLNRLTLCLKRAQELDRAKAAVLEHLANYPAAVKAKGFASIAKRVGLPSNNSFKPTPLRGAA